MTIGQGVYVYDWRSGRSATLPTMFGVAVHPGGGYAVAGRTAWTLPSGEERAGFRGVCSDCRSVPAFSRDGRRLAVSDDGGLTVYDTRTREEIDRIAGWEIGAVPVFSPDGGLIAGVGERITVWRPGAHEPLLLSRDPDDRPSAAAFGPDGLRYLSEDAVVTLKQAPPAGQELDAVRLGNGGRSVITHVVGSTEVVLNGRSRRPATSRRTTRSSPSATTAACWPSGRPRASRSATPPPGVSWPSSGPASPAASPARPCRRPRASGRPARRRSRSGRCPAAGGSSRCPGRACSAGPPTPRGGSPGWTRTGCAWWTWRPASRSERRWPCPRSRRTSGSAPT
ncbi:hypothetical protein ACFQ0B_69090 [Nonomuraea thailandensis]